MRTIGWMLSLLGSIIGGFTAWAQQMPALRLHLILPHGNLPGDEITWVAALLGLLAVILMWLGLPRIGGLLVFCVAVGGLFGADQLWTTAACVLFCGGVLSMFAPQSPPSQSRA